MSINQVKGQYNINPKPKLIIGLVVDQMRYEYISKYWENFSNKGFKKLINNGAFCKNTETGYMLNQSSTGHATISTGANPSVHGIISDEWYARISDKIIYCSEDSEMTTIGSESEEGRKSPHNLFSSTIGDEMKSFNSKSKVIGISIKDHSAIMLAGHKADAAYWYDNKSGKWISSSYYMENLPTWVKGFNNIKLPDSYLERLWNLLLPSSSYSYKGIDNNSAEVGFGRNENSYPYNFKKLRKKNLYSEYELLKSTPQGNTLTTDFALTAIQEEKLGYDNITDLLMISFSSTDYIGHMFGPESFEMEDTYIRLDQEISHFIDVVEKLLGRNNILIFLTSNHGVANKPAKMIAEKMNAGFFRYRNAIALLKSYLNAIYGQGDWISFYHKHQLYFNRSLIEDSGIDLNEIQSRSTNFLLDFDGIANVLTSTTLQNTNYSNGIFSAMQNSFNQKLSGDLIINLEPGWIEETDLATDHNSAYEYDIHVPLIWYGWDIPFKTINRKISIKDIAPTLSFLLDIQAPNSSTGEIILEIIE